tara:strand:- start:351 stop:1094 length:744 start_codon:yes stop_codon:yes gene_type:complete
MKKASKTNNSKRRRPPRRRSARAASAASATPQEEKRGDDGRIAPLPLQPVAFSAASAAPAAASAAARLPQYKNYCSNNGVKLNPRGMILRNNVLDNCRISQVHNNRGNPDARPCSRYITESEAFKRYEALGRCLAHRDIFTRDCVNIGANPYKDATHIANEAREQKMARDCLELGIEKEEQRNRLEQNTLGAYMIQKPKKSQRSQRSRRGSAKKTRRKKKKRKTRQKRKSIEKERKKKETRRRRRRR